MIRIQYLSVVLVFTAVAQAAGPLVFERQRIGNVTYEAASAFDVNNDGHIDIYSGEYWFEGPDFTNAHKVADIRRVDDYYDDFCNYPLDVNGDGYLDVITGGWWGRTLAWRENPRGRPVPWTTHAIDETGNVEVVLFWDVDGDGQVEIVPSAGGHLTVYKLVRDAQGKGTARFSKHVIKEKGVGYGLGFGDLNGDGRGDFLIPNGWLEAPPKPLAEPWTWHGEFDLGQMPSLPILVYDVNGDGLADLIAGEAHNYGLAWWQQKKDAAGLRTWVKHDVETDRSQYHNMMLVDIDNDGQPEVVTGKRYRAHCGRDPGAYDPLGVYYFNIDGGKFERVTLDYGPAAAASGVGIYFWVADVDGNGWLDIIAPGKDGLYLFRNRGPLNPPGR